MPKDVPLFPCVAAPAGDTVPRRRWRRKRDVFGCLWPLDRWAEPHTGVVSARVPRAIDDEGMWCKCSRRPARCPSHRLVSSLSPTGNPSRAAGTPGGPVWPTNRLLP